MYVNHFLCSKEASYTGYFYSPAAKQVFSILRELGFRGEARGRSTAAVTPLPKPTSLPRRGHFHLESFPRKSKNPFQSGRRNEPLSLSGTVSRSNLQHPPIWCRCRSSLAHLPPFPTGRIPAPAWEPPHSPERRSGCCTRRLERRCGFECQNSTRTVEDPTAIACADMCAYPLDNNCSDLATGGGVHSHCCPASPWFRSN